MEYDCWPDQDYGLTFPRIRQWPETLSRRVRGELFATQSLLATSIASHWLFSAPGLDGLPDPLALLYLTSNNGYAIAYQHARWQSITEPSYFVFKVQRDTIDTGGPIEECRVDIWRGRFDTGAWELIEGSITTAGNPSIGFGWNRQSQIRSLDLTIAGLQQLPQFTPTNISWLISPILKGGPPDPDILWPPSDSPFDFFP